MAELTARSPSNTGSKQTDAVGELRFKLELTVPGGPIGRFQEVTGLAAELEVKEYPEGGMNDFVHKLPTRVKWPNIVLKRGVTHEKGLLQWFWDTRVSGKAANQHAVTLTLQGPGSQVVRVWSLQGAFPVKWTGPTLNVSSNSIATEQLEIAHHGLDRVT
jgi:phage tail-like protein